MEAVELGEKSNLRAFGPYHQESGGSPFGLNGYDLPYGNSPTSQNTCEFDRLILMEHDRVRYAQNPKGISTDNGKEDETHKPRRPSPISEQNRSDYDDAPDRYENHGHDRQYNLQARRDIQLVRQRLVQRVYPFSESIHILAYPEICMKS